MKAVVYQEYGEPGILKIEEIEKPIQKETTDVSNFNVGNKIFRFDDGTLSSFA